MGTTTTKETTTIICFIEKSTGKPVRILKEETNSTNCCGEYMYSLKTCGTDLPIWCAKSVIHAQYVLSNPEFWYNSSAKAPSHKYDLADVEICQRVETIETIDTVLDRCDTLKEVTIKILEDNLENIKYESDREIYTRLIKKAKEGSYTKRLYEIEDYINKEK